MVQEAMSKLDEKRIEAVDCLNDITNEFDRINCRFLDENVDALPVEQIVTQFKSLVNEDNEVTKSFGVESIHKLVSYQYFSSQLNKFINRTKRLPRKLVRAAESTEVLNHFVCKPDDNEVQGIIKQFLEYMHKNEPLGGSLIKTGVACKNKKSVVVRAVTAPPQPQQRSPASTGSLKHAMTMTEKILSRAAEKSKLSPGDNVWVNVDLLMTHDVCGPGTIGIFKQEFGSQAKVPPTLRFIMDGEMPHYLLSKDLILQIIGEITVSGGTYRAMEFTGSTVERLSGKTTSSFEPLYSDEAARYFNEYRFDVSKLEPLVAKPHSPDNRALARECRDVKIDRVYIGSCTGGKTEDFMAAAKLLSSAGQKVKVPTFLVPATQKVWMDLYALPVPGANGKTCAQIFEEAGCDTPASPNCGACLGGPRDTYARMNEPQ
ncbi:hypothetical protein KI387_005473, partial [Taxus chinensis]